MKYHITPKQAKEVTEEHFYSMFNEIVKREDWYKYHHKKMDIGKMIDWLDGVHITKGSAGIWYVQSYNIEYNAIELVDALWEAVKDNLIY